MKIEYAIYDIESNDKNFKKNLSDVLEYPVQQISVLPQHIKIAKKLIPKHVQLSSPIDYPLGISSDKIRQDMIKYAIDEGAECVEVVAPNKALCNRNYKQIQNDIMNNFNICIENMIDIAYMLEYRRFTFNALSRIVKTLTNSSVYKFYVSSGDRLDNIHDHLIALAVLQKESSDAIIPYNGNLWLKEQADLIYNTGLKTIRIRTMNALDIIFNKIA